MISFKGVKVLQKKSILPYRIPDGELPNFKDEPKNKLESIVILVTSREINEGSLERLLNNISETTPPNDLDLNIFTNNSDHEPVSLENVNSLFKSVNIVNINIDPKDDIYFSDPFAYLKDGKTAPKYGLVSGPNILFMKAMEVCKKYNTTLVLETDCKLFPEWFEKSTTYVSMEYFLVSGSTYDGEYVPKPTDVIYHTFILHLNGVAFYKTGSPVFQCVMTVLDNYIQFVVANGDITRGYDHFMVEMVLFYITNSLKVEPKKFWKNVLRYMFKTSLIVNLSPERDSHLREKDVLDIHKQCVILHKKYLLQPKQKFLWSAKG